MGAWFEDAEDLRLRFVCVRTSDAKGHRGHFKGRLEASGGRVHPPSTYTGEAADGSNDARYELSKRSAGGKEHSYFKHFLSRKA